MTKLLNKVLADRRGATAVEYGLIVSLIVIAVMGAIISVSEKTNGMWNNVSGKILAAGKSGGN